GGGPPDTGGRRRPDGLAGRARHPPRRPARRQAAAGGRLPPPHLRHRPARGPDERRGRHRSRHAMRALAAHVRLELALTFRNGESLLLTLGTPVAVLVFFSLVDVLPIDGDAVDFLAPGTLALATLATAFTNLAIATGFDRSYGVLKRLGATPLGRGRL